MRLPFVGALHEAHAGDNGTKFYFLQRDMLLLIIEKYFDVRALFFLGGPSELFWSFGSGVIIGPVCFRFSRSRFFENQDSEISQLSGESAV